MFIMQAREQLSITPQQFTKLQYLQADVIRAFAPLREEMELLQAEVQAKVANGATEPPPELKERGAGIQKKVKELQANFSDRAIKEVLEPKQRAMLEELLRGKHNPAPNGG